MIPDGHGQTSEFSSRSEAYPCENLTTLSRDTLSYVASQLHRIGMIIQPFSPTSRITTSAIESPQASPPVELPPRLTRLSSFVTLRSCLRRSSNNNESS